MNLPNNNLVIIKLAVKYNPPTLALFYKLNRKDRKKRRYNIFLNQLAFLPSPHEITEQLYIEHKNFLNENNVDYDQVFKMVKMIFQNFQNQGKLAEQQESDKSIQFENDEELYYSSYDPKKSQQCNQMKINMILDIKSDMIGISQSMDQTTPSNKRSRLQNAISPKYINSKPTTNFTNESNQVQGHESSDQDMWTGSKSTSKNNLNLSLSGMQQFMQISGGGKLNQKPAYKNSNRSSTNSSVVMPNIQKQISQQDTSQTNINQLNNRQQQQLKNRQYSDENNLNISNFVEEGNISNLNLNKNSMYIDDQLYESPQPTMKSNKFLQQQQLIENQQQYYLQQQSGYQSQPKKLKNQFLKNMQSIRQGGIQEIF